MTTSLDELKVGAGIGAVAFVGLFGLYRLDCYSERKKWSWGEFFGIVLEGVASSYTPESTRTYRDKNGYVTGYSTKRGDTITYKDRNGYVKNTVTKS